MENKFKCRENCGECCGMIPIDLETFSDNCKKFQTNPIEVIRTCHGIVAITSDFFCIFLNREIKKCAIYKDRPLICQKYGISDNINLACPYLKPNGSLRSEAMKKRIDRHINKLVKMQSRRADVLKKMNPALRIFKNGNNNLTENRGKYESNTKDAVL